MFRKIVRLVDIEQIEAMLGGQVSEGLVEEYYRFGSIVLSEIQSVGSQIEGKLTTVLGLTAGVVAFLLFSTSLKTFAVTQIVVGWSSLIAMVAIGAAGLGLWGWMWRLPSEADWFKQELRDPLLLKKYHVVSLLCAHQQRIKLVAFKSGCLRAAQLLLAMSVLIVAGALVTAVIF